MIIKCGYCHKCLSDNEYQVLARKTRTSKKRQPSPKIYHPSDSDIPELKTMRAGEKHQWLKLHRDIVTTYYQDNGDAETRKHFGISRLDILPELTNWLIMDYKPQLSDSEIKIKILEEKNKLLYSEIAMLRSQLPDVIAHLSIEEQIKIYTFKLSEAVRELKISTASEKLNLNDMYTQEPNNKIILKKRTN